MSGQPKATRAGRTLDYLVEMFPPWTYIPHGLATFFAPYFALQALAGRAPLALTWRSVAGAFTVVLILALLRVFDELKDVETDLRLGKAGDPRYADRAIVTGRITVGDLVALRWTLTALLLVLNLPLGFPLPLLAFLVLFGVCWLSFKWFFWPAVSENLLLAFITHNPLVLVIYAYVVAVFAADFGTEAVSGWAVPLGLAMWLPMAAWETSRKVRHPDDETDYETYSKLLGWRVAGTVPALFVIGAAGCLIAVLRQTSVGTWFLVVVALGALLAVLACVRFLLSPSTASAKLQPAFELYTLVSGLGFAIALWVGYGVSLP